MILSALSALEQIRVLWACAQVPEFRRMLAKDKDL